MIINDPKRGPCVVIFVPWIWRDGKRVYPKHARVFRFLIPVAKYRAGRRS